MNKLNAFKQYKDQSAELDALFTAIHGFDNKTVKVLLAAFPNLVNKRDDLEKIAIHECIKAENLFALREVMKTPNVDMNAICLRTGNTPATAAVFNKNMDIFKTIVSDFRVNLEIENNQAVNTVVALMKEDCYEGYCFALPLIPFCLLKRIDCFDNSIITKLISFGHINWLNETLEFYEITREDTEESLSDESSKQQSSLINLESLSNTNILSFLQKSE